MVSDATSNTSILVIDDEPVMREFVSAALGEAGFEVHQAEDGALGLSLIRSFRFDIVITDLLMPNKEGIETCRELRTHAPDIGIIAISGAAGASTYFTILRHMGVGATLHKPFSREELLDAVQTVLANR